MEDPLLRFSKIFIDPKISRPGITKLIASSHTYHPVTPVYLLEGESSSFSKEIFEKLAISGSFTKPLSAEDLSFTLQLPSPKIFTQYAKNQTTPPKKDQKEYTPVPIYDFLSGQTLFFDVYVRLPSGKFLKILEAKDHFTLDRLEQYLKKEVSHLYIRESSLQRCVSYCDVLALSLVDEPGVSQDLKVRQTLDQGDEIVELIAQELTQDKELQEIHLEYLHKFLFKVQKLVKQLEIKNKKAVHAYLDQAFAHEHAVATTFISALVSAALGFETSHTLHIIGMASMLHDVGLYSMPDEIKNGLPEKMTPEQLKIYQTHPDRGARILGRVRGIDPLVVQAVAQHHERKDQSGFPKVAKGDQIHRVSEVVGLSDEFADLLIRKKANPSFNLVEYLHASTFHGFSYPVVNAFKAVFL